MLDGQAGEAATKESDGPERLMLQRLPARLVRVNTRMTHWGLAELARHGRLPAVGPRALSSLKWQHGNPNGIFTRDRPARLPLAQRSETACDFAH